MVSKCANPACSTPFQYLRDGKVFRVDIGSPGAPVRPAARLQLVGQPTRQVEHFWLCGDCAASFTLAYSPADGIKLVRRQPEVRRAAAS